MRYAILGGSFNPVHIGHLYLADTVLTSLNYDRIILVPAFQSPFKIDAEGAPPQDRLQMLAASIPADTRLTIDGCEINREGVSYTIDTLKDIIARYMPDGKPGLILGDDLASTFYKWRNPGEIAELADIIIARRLAPDHPDTGIKETSAPEEYGCSLAPGGVTGAANFPYPHRALHNEIINVSSRLIREKIKNREAWHYLVPAGARHVIESRQLYGCTPSAAGAGTIDTEKGEASLCDIIADLEKDARGALHPGRFMHSRNTALLSWDLCRRFGLDPYTGYLAGIAHDICKSLGNDELIRMVKADGGTISKMEAAKPGLLHARAAAIWLRKKYGIGSKDILEAIRYHTTGSRDMGALAKVVYIADKIEVSRKGVDPALRDLGRSADLDTLFKAVLYNTVAYLRSRNLDISYGTRRLLGAMEKRNNQ